MPDRTFAPRPQPSPRPEPAPDLGTIASDLQSGDVVCIWGAHRTVFTGVHNAQNFVTDTRTFEGRYGVRAP